MSRTGKIYATVSLKVKILRIFSKSKMKCSLSFKEYFDDLGSPNLISPCIKDCFGVIYSPSNSSDSSDPEGDKDSSSIPSLSFVLSFTVSDPRSFFAFASSSFFFSSSFSRCFLIRASISSSLPSKESVALSYKSVESSKSFKSALSPSFPFPPDLFASL